MRTFKNYNGAIADFEAVLVLAPPTLRGRVNKAVRPDNSAPYEEWRARRDAAELLPRSDFRTCLLSALGVL